MLQIDIRTLFYFFAVGNLFASLLFIFFVRSNHNQKLVINIYVIGKVLMSISWFLYALRDNIPDIYSIALANLLKLFGIVFEVFGISSLSSGFIKKRFTWYIIAAMVSSIIFLFFAQAEAYIRIFILTSFIFIIHCYGGVALILKKERRKLEFVAGILFLTISIVFLIRACDAIFVDSTVHVFSQQFLTIISYTIVFIIPFYLSILFLLVLKEQDQDEIIIKNEIIQEDNLKLQKLNDTKDKFFSIIAHDLKNPVSALAQLGGILMDSKNKLDEKKRKQVVEAITKSSKTALNLLDNLLQWAISESGNLISQPEPVQLNKLIVENQNLFEENINNKNIRFNNLVDEHIKIYADYNMASTIVRNLLVNAVKYTPENGKIEISSSQDNDFTQVVIADSGVGIHPEALPKLFEIDSKHKTSGTNDEPGTGLGLKLCKEFVIKNGGKIWVESQQNKGSMFYFTLPTFKKEV